MQVPKKKQARGAHGQTFPLSSESFSLPSSRNGRSVPLVTRCLLRPCAGVAVPDADGDDCCGCCSGPMPAFRRSGTDAEHGSVAGTATLPPPKLLLLLWRPRADATRPQRRSAVARASSPSPAAA